jgi:hypothetical protein
MPIRALRGPYGQLKIDNTLGVATSVVQRVLAPIS